MANMIQILVLRSLVGGERNNHPELMVNDGEQNAGSYKAITESEFDEGHRRYIGL